ncbi:BTAD domain-containing putative transcriptional regulator [Kitasatospora sp. NPDC048298]|uniref:AfsR/SARP family transcriptional regulator n=1 Tax=Kitasatospora sp. NPDC048298 TaxID=3364049 RepID=UPI0037205B4E
MRIRLLGPTELRAADGRTIPVSGAKRRGVLALLALEFGRVVRVERFYDLLWDETPPAQAKAVVQGHVAALRKHVNGTSLTLETQASGYLLNGDPEAVDVHRFRALTARAGEEPDGATAAALFGEALRLWEGDALADLPDTELRRDLADRLDRAHEQAVHDWAERLLRIGQGSAALPVLEQLLHTEWLQEPTAALLVRCLHQAGRPAEALRLYHRARSGLAAELGLRPGPALQAALATVLADERATAGPGRATEPGRVPEQGRTPEHGHAPDRLEPTRRQDRPPAPPAPAVSADTDTDTDTPTAARPAVSPLPRRTPGFVGRAAELDWLDQACGTERPDHALAVVVGAAGAGKTATVVRWAHTAATGFRDGHLHHDLRGFDPACPSDPAEVLGRFLRALGLAEAEIPEDRVRRGALYRALTADRELLVLLDNVRSAADVTELLPAGPRSATVVTSRNTLEDLVVSEGAALLRLEALPETDALDLLGQVLGERRLAEEPAAARRLAELCDHLPLALRIAAARLAAQPAWTVGHLVAEVEDERTRLPALDAHGGVSVRSALNLTLRLLPPAAVRLVALLAVAPGPEIDVPTAAALLAAPPGEARRALGTLTAHHLLTETAPGRYGRHDLIRLYGRELLDADPPANRHRALVRLLDYYLAAAMAGACLLQPHLTEFERPVGFPPPVLPDLPDVRSALEWFRAEEPAVRALVAAATGAGEDERAWQLAFLANCLYFGSGRLTDRLDCLRHGLSAATLTGDPVATALLEAATARALSGKRRPAEALVLARRAHDRTRDHDGAAQIYTMGVLVVALADHGDLADARRLSEATVRRMGELGLDQAGATVLSNAATLANLGGDGRTALRHAREARRLLAPHPHATFHLLALVEEAQALRLLGLVEESEQAWREAAARCRASAARHLEAAVEQRCADFLLSTGRPAEAAARLRTAVALYGELGDTGSVAELGARVRVIEAELPPRDGPDGELPPRSAPEGEFPAQTATGRIPRAARIGRSARTA